MAHCIQGKPHIYLRKCKCGCQFWTFRRPKRINQKNLDWLHAAARATKIWTLNNELGARPCEHHRKELEQFK